MGTSKSQPSPRGNSDAGKGWKQFDKDLSTTCTPQSAVEKVIQAYSSEFKGTTTNILVDSGVEFIEVLVQNFNPPEGSNYFSIASEFIDSARKGLAEKGVNSFLSELAISSVGGSIMSRDQEERLEIFRRNYITKVVDYTLSRDFPRLFGSTNLTNHFQMEGFVNQVRKHTENDRAFKKPLRDFINEKLKKFTRENE